MWNDKWFSFENMDQLLIDNIVVKKSNNLTSIRGAIQVLHNADGGRGGV